MTEFEVACLAIALVTFQREYFFCLAIGNSKYITVSICLPLLKFICRFRGFFSSKGNDQVVKWNISLEAKLGGIIGLFAKCLHTSSHPRCPADHQENSVTRLLLIVQVEKSHLLSACMNGFFSKQGSHHLVLVFFQESPVPRSFASQY